MSYSTDIKEKIYSLRQKSLSYSKIQKLTKIPKSTLSDWLSDEDWSIKIKNNLTEKHLKNYKPNLIKALKVMAKMKDDRYRKYRAEALIDYKKFKNDPLFIFGLGLYWGEGDKKSGNMVAVTNSDPNILSVIAKFYRKYLSLDESKLGIKLFIYKDINIDFAIDFWSKLLKIPRNQFIKVQILESRAKLTKTKLKYGICTLYCSNTEFHIKIREWIRLLSLDMRV
ncbi:hypothetical protein A2422_01450 [Candidatus Woesebacteria bacterium RIFOXYC1_FULL_31_51]|uniref:Uncharacterized protein n=1 Tax=Candidatus Woesebacteria bacterium GW2011_GWC2_31_9 TaxID=1618586 RepID=A0A0F9YWZ5_9BACT|nr:MAG: hypothetical protein UR17_C0001G0742 [Candidatus Woesebacteria bacterium GW2011_GWF1_31_35]KKP22653.1 MAG: hypothetical protein UR11_C0002G0033 [Candidatus Woesebacteria bacterium GW2011_GWC1_30_29]KKP26915.1 MAG: hypothetical protein UR13_C0001G0010 [Candidatus Woesebacteria bacterium GW2011_GWD1_31_12]KKP27190.1 MAG: hypothetical protein UR16_C0006G0079 [Candidatus Woesebacteria bacterium GW2011_GWB1_31_29]KKP30966.1 MAG: hypothetical protein UR21_C0019G0012 [Candidatus Woesebacteria 